MGQRQVVWMKSKEKWTKKLKAKRDACREIIDEWMNIHEWMHACISFWWNWSEMQISSLKNKQLKGPFKYKSQTLVPTFLSSELKKLTKAYVHFRGHFYSQLTVLLMDDWAQPDANQNTDKNDNIGKNFSYTISRLKISGISILADCTMIFCI